MDERAIIARCQSGDLSSFEELYSAYVERIYRFLYYRTKSKEVAEDLTGDVFLKALQGISKTKEWSNCQCLI